MNSIFGSSTTSEVLIKKLDYFFLLVLFQCWGIFNPNKHVDMRRTTLLKLNSIKEISQFSSWHTIIIIIIIISIF